MKTRLALITALMLAACSGGSGDDERMPLGHPPPWGQYCIDLGYKPVGSEGCQFPDGSVCDMILFYRGLCGHEHSYCEQHGGVFTSEAIDMGTWTGIEGICTMPDGARCADTYFLKNGVCP